MVKVAYCTGFWCTNIGNAFFSLGVEYVLKKVLGDENVTIVSDLQTYTTGYGKRLYPDKNQLEYISQLDVDYVVLAGPVISRYFLLLWKDILLKLKERGIGYMILSAGTMKLDSKSQSEIELFFTQCPPYIFCSREESTYQKFGKYAAHAYNGICFSFFVSDYYKPCGIDIGHPYWVCNFDKIGEPEIWCGNSEKKHTHEFEFDGDQYFVNSPPVIASKTDRFTDALIYAKSIFWQSKRADEIGKYRIIRTDQRFHPHYRKKIYSQANTFCADVPYGYLNIYANSCLTLSDRIHACAVTLAFGHKAMLFINTERMGLLERVGARDIIHNPVALDLALLEKEKHEMLNWLKETITQKGKVS